MNFIREFSDERTAMSFARVHGGKVVIRYDWNSYANKMVKNYRVVF